MISVVPMPQQPRINYSKGKRVHPLGAERSGTHQERQYLFSNLISTGVVVTLQIRLTCHHSLIFPTWSRKITEVDGVCR